MCEGTQICTERQGKYAQEVAFDSANSVEVKGEFGNSFSPLREPCRQLFVLGSLKVSSWRMRGKANLATKEKGKGYERLRLTCKQCRS